MPSLLLVRTLTAELRAQLLAAGSPLRGLLTWADPDRAVVPALLSLLTHSPLLVAGPAAATQLAALWREQVGPRLNTAELQLLALLVMWDLSCAAIAARLGVAPAAVKVRVRRLAAKLGVPARRSWKQFGSGESSPAEDGRHRAVTLDDRPAPEGGSARYRPVDDHEGAGISSTPGGGETR